MTITSEISSQENPVRVVRIEWMSVLSGLWVGQASGEFAGMIEEHPGRGFAATTRLSEHLGMFPTMDDAKASFAA